MIVTVKPGVQFTTIAPCGFRILGALEKTAQYVGHDLMITSACDGAHSGPDDPHHRGEAYDVRTHGLSPNAQVETLEALKLHLGPKFFAFLEAPGTDNEHIHVQLRKGYIYP